MSAGRQGRTEPPDEVISSVKHHAVAAARASLSATRSAKPSCFLADGHKLVSQALDAGAPIQTAFFLEPVEGPEEQELYARLQAANVPCHKATRGVFFRILGLGYETSVRVLAIVSRRTKPCPTAAAPGAAVLVGEQIQDPRNVGVLIRTAEGAGLCGVVFSADSADPFSRASVRSTTGSIFRLPLTVAADLGQCLEQLKKGGFRVVGTSAKAKTPCWEADLTAPCALLFGNETEGLSEQTRAACDEVVGVPMRGSASSHNVTVAAGMVLYERLRQLVGCSGAR